MTFPRDADFRLGTDYFRADESHYDWATGQGQPPCRHWVRSLFSGVLPISGDPGARNINPDQLRWDSTEFVGEGQKFLKHDDEILAHRFYRSEGLDFRTAGEFKLNRSTVLQSPLDSTGGASTTFQGNDFADVTGTSTDDGTDTRLNAIDDEVQTVAHTPNAAKVQADFYLYNEGVQLTTVEGNAMRLIKGSGTTTGTDFRLSREGAVCATDAIDTLTAGEPVEVNWYAFKSASSEQAILARFKIRNVTSTSGDDFPVYVSDPIKISGTTTSLVHTTVFTPKADKEYEFRVEFVREPPNGVNLRVDKVTYGETVDPSNAVQVRVYNDTGAAVVAGTTKTVLVSNTSSAHVVSVTYTASAATDYKYRVLYKAGNQRPKVDKVIATVQSTSAWTLDDIELGALGKVWLVGHRAGVDSDTWTYDFSNEAWVEEQAVTGTNGATCRALAHTDKWQYGLFSDGKVYQWDDGSTDNDYTGATTGAVGMAICQNRMFVLSEDSTNGVDVTVFAVDADVSGGATASLTSTEVTSALNTADTTLRQRMVGTPTGARFFVNYSDVTSVIYEADISTGTLVVSEIARLDIGAKATCITYVGGITFIGGQMFAETGETAVPTMWAIDQQNQLVRVGDFRSDNPDSRAPIKMQPYDTSIWVLQGNYVWRYWLRTGGLFLEYQLGPATPANQMGIAVVRAHQFAVFSDEGVFTTGSVGTYRSSSVTDGNTWISSITNFGLPNVTKQLHFIEVTTDDLPSNTAVSLEYQIDQDGTWVPAGTFTSGSKHRVTLLTEDDTVTCETIQLRIGLQSLAGTNTPTVRAVSARAFPAEFEEFIDVQLRCYDEDSSDHIQGQQKTGQQLARALQAAQRSKEAISFESNYHGVPETLTNRESYVCRIEEFDNIFSKRGESSMRVRLRVL